MYRPHTPNTLSYVASHEVKVNQVESQRYMEVYVRNDYKGLLFPTEDGTERWTSCINVGQEVSSDYVHLPALPLSDALARIACTLGAVPQATD